MEQRYCLGCMRKYTEAEEVCPVCGYHHGKEKWPPYALRPGMILDDGKYLVGKLLGQGGFGLTYVGLDTVLDLKVAIKELYPRTQAGRIQGSSEILWYNDSDRGHAARESFLKEARRMAMVDSIPGIVQVREVFSQNSTAYIVMNFIEGETLKNRLIRTGVMTPPACVSLLNPVMEAMEKAHKAGLVHRDISPDNIMIDRNGQVWLLDMGAAKEIETRGSNPYNPTQPVVKHGFSPLEQEIGEPTGSWTDVYAMSATVYYCLTGDVVPDARTRSWAEKDPLSFPKGIPVKMASVLTRGLALQTKDRIQTMRELQRELKNGLINDEDDKKEISNHKNQKKRIALAVVALTVGCVAVLCYMQNWLPFNKPEANPIPAQAVSSAPSETPDLSPTPAATNLPSTPTPSPASDATVTVVNYENGVYEGEIKDGKRNGQGTMTYTSGNVYVGEWVEDQRSGQGTFTLANSTEDHPNYYTGQWEQDLKNGQGTQYYGNGNVYKGEWKNDQIKGKGSFTWYDGDNFTGEWENNQMSGHGTFTWADSTEKSPHYYIGQWLQGLKNGHGTLYSSDGIYDGEWKNGKKNGQGKMTYTPSGDVYEGDWVDDQRNGQGTYTFADNTEDTPHYSIGQWENDFANGQGTMYYANGDIYEGEWVNGQRNGTGIYTFKTGDSFQAVWKDDVFESPVIYIFADGSVAEYEWKGDEWVKSKQ